MAASFFRGTQLDQNVKFKDKDRELTKKWSFPPEFDTFVDLKKVQLDVIKLWVERRITELMGYDDEIVINFAISSLEDYQGHPDKRLDPKHLQVQLTGNLQTQLIILIGFLDDKAPLFMKELWDLLLSAQKEVSGIPPSLIKEKISEKNRKLEQIEQAKKQLEKIRNFADLPQPKQNTHSDYNASRNNQQSTSSKQQTYDNRDRRRDDNGRWGGYKDDRNERKGRSRSPRNDRDHKDVRRQDRNDRKRRNHSSEKEDSRERRNRREDEKRHQKHKHRRDRSDSADRRRDRKRGKEEEKKKSKKHSRRSDSASSKSSSLSIPNEKIDEPNGEK